MTIANLQTLSNFLIGGTSVQLSNANFLIFLNAAYERIVGKIIAETTGGRWQFGDLNYTAFPTYTFNLTAGTRIYDLDTSLTGAITIMGVEILDVNSNYYVIDPITLRDIHKTGISWSEFHETSGKPIYYEKRENQIVLYPAPATADVTLTAGCRIFFLRTADTFTEAQRSTGSKEPGFPGPWHDILAYETAHTFAVAKALSNVNFLKNEVDRKEKEMMNFIARRDQDERHFITPKSINFR